MNTISRWYYTRKALKQIRNVPAERLRDTWESVGSHGSHSCPIAIGFGLEARESWGKLSDFNRFWLFTHGWTEGTYNAFIDWYDNGNNYSPRFWIASEMQMREQKLSTILMEEMERRRSMGIKI